jgi:hypothetical protein
MLKRQQQGTSSYFPLHFRKIFDITNILVLASDDNF